MDSRKTLSQLTQEVKHLCCVSLHNTLETLQTLVKFTLRLFFEQVSGQWRRYLLGIPRLAETLFNDEKPKRNLCQNPLDGEMAIRGHRVLVR